MTAIFIATKEESLSEPLENHGSALMLNFDLISAIGEDHGLARLDEFVYVPTEDMMDFLKQSGATEEQIEKANPPRWFSANDGLQLISNYIDIIEAYHTLNKNTREKVLNELNCFKKIFRVLVQESNYWHFEYDI